MITLKDALVVNDGKVLYKRSEHKKLDIDLHFHLTPAKFFVDEIFFLPPVTPFTYNAGEIWFIISYTEGGATKTDAVVWSMKTNLVTRKPYQS
jgi:hypothetical protein